MISRRQLWALAPLAVAGVAGVSFFAMLKRMQTGAFDPHAVGSPMDGKPIPAFALPGVAGANGFSSDEITRLKQPVVLNFFASWCVPCVEEMQTLAALAQQMPIWGIAYKDKDPATQQFLGRNGNPYARLAADHDGFTAINFGLYGVPETYVIDKSGIIRARYAGALTDDIVQNQLLPLMKSLA